MKWESRSLTTERNVEIEVLFFGSIREVTETRSIDQKTWISTLEKDPNFHLVWKPPKHGNLALFRQT